jgi:hypothetical protein
VLTPILKRDGQGSWFMKIGTAFTNKDDSINLYIDAIPVGVAPGKGMTLQIRELDENDLRQREASRSSYGQRPVGAHAGFDAGSGTGPGGGGLGADLQGARHGVHLGREGGDLDGPGRPGPLFRRHGLLFRRPRGTSGDCDRGDNERLPHLVSPSSFLARPGGVPTATHPRYR